MIYEVDIPRAVDLQTLAQDLRDKAADLKVDISIQHRHIFEVLHRI
jgi:glycine cleavage system transcriptional repressor